MLLDQERALGSKAMGGGATIKSEKPFTGFKRREGGSKRWTPEEEAELRALVEEYGETAWAQIGLRMPHRSVGALEQHWQVMLGVHPSVLQSSKSKYSYVADSAPRYSYTREKPPQIPPAAAPPAAAASSQQPDLENAELLPPESVAVMAAAPPEGVPVYRTHLSHPGPGGGELRSALPQRAG